MKKFRCLFLVVVFLFGISSLVLVGASVLSGPTAGMERVIALPELETPRQIVVEKGKAYISDKRDILVYDLATGALVTRIGKIGQGPGEFRFMPGRMAAAPEKLVVADFPKLQYFSLEGIYQGQVDLPRLLSPYPLLPVGANFVGFPMESKNDGSLLDPAGRIFGPDLKRLRDFYGDLPAGPPPPPAPGSPEQTVKSDALLIRDYGELIVYENRIYVADSRKGFAFSIFDESGTLIREIKHPIDRVKVPGSFIDGIVKEWKASKYWEAIYSRKNPVVPEFFPDIISFKVDGGRIYAVTSAQKDGLYEVVVMDLEGKILKKEFRFPLAPNFEAAFLNGLKYDIEGNKIVWFAYNEEKEIYELHIR
ncbi:MAG: 6-bladed beta-propeller [Candidatus Aminicenantes bacterium]|nr:6-bladed beta-propeller [Candidatus Aminicenantes bacterium]